MHGLELDWFSSYLYGCQQVTKIGDNYSHSTRGELWCATGVYFRATYFILDMNDLSRVIQNSDSMCMLMIQLFSFRLNLKLINRTLNREIALISKWLDFVTLHINITKNMPFVTQAKLRRSDDNLHVMIRSAVIDNVSQFKYLRQWLDPYLTWNMHIDKLVKQFGGSPEGQKCFTSAHIEYVI